ncbi:epimerase [Candidatus Marinamargulisbacteria bacterium SCGC AAA071-K20]|nr:epimerase [Candidatus Marinamargulisbacteria bacterium SCGC AAA071-K20]
MTILITGAAGFIGSHLCDYFIKHTNETIVGIDNYNSFYDPSIKKRNLAHLDGHSRFKCIKGDILDKGLLQNIFENEKITEVIHLAAWAGVRPSIENPDIYYQVNIIGTLNLLNLAKDYKVNRFLQASSSSVYGNNKKTPFSELDAVDLPISPYAATKKSCELMAYNTHHLYKIPIACIRFFTVYGPRQRPEMAIHKFTRLINEGKEIPVFNNGNCLRDYTYVDDIIQGIIAIYNQPKLTYDIVNLGESQTISTLDLIKLIEKYTGQSAKLKLLPAQPGDVEQTYADISHAIKVYQYKPQFTVEKGVEAFVKWYKKQEALTIH